MAAFGKQLSEVDLAAVITYERNAWGNNTGDMVTPKDVLDFKQAEEAAVRGSGDECSDRRPWSCRA